MTNTTRITVFIDGTLFQKLHRVTSEIGISKEALLSSNLPSELHYLTKLPANGPKASRLFRALAKIRADKRRLNITLTKKHADEMRRLCKQKGITRDQFISEYISFLVNGDPAGSCVGPLSKIDALLTDPRFEYSESSDSNPYDELHANEPEVEQAISMLRQKIQVGSKREDQEPTD